MIRTEFGIISDFDENKDYTGYHPEKYNCTAIDDDLYMNDWWADLEKIDTLNVYSKGILQPQKALSRWGITIIPPGSLHCLLEIVKNDKRFHEDVHLERLAVLIEEAVKNQKYMIHYGV